MRLSDAVEGHDNNFNLIRMIAASGVLVSHAYPIAMGSSALQPFESWLGFTLGHVSVLVFFAVSGLLITQSFVRSRSFARWCMARALRIFPALIVVTSASALILGPLVTALSAGDYYADISAYTYILRNSTMAFMQYPLPGVFADNPLPMAVNGSLWTLFYEMTCYAGVAILGLLGAFARKKIAYTATILLLAIFTAFWILEAQSALHVRFVNLFHLGLPFALGGLFFHLRRFIVLRFWIAVALVVFAAATRSTPVFQQLFVLSLTYCTFYLAYVPTGRVRNYNRLGDYSYGMYVYAFPAQQTVAFALVSTTAITNMIVAFPIALALAIASWHLVEQPALSLKQRATQAPIPIVP